MEKKFSKKHTLFSDTPSIFYIDNTNGMTCTLTIVSGSALLVLDLKQHSNQIVNIFNNVFNIVYDYACVIKS